MLLAISDKYIYIVQLYEQMTELYENTATNRIDRNKQIMQ